MMGRLIQADGDYKNGKNVFKRTYQFDDDNKLIRRTFEGNLTYDYKYISGTHAVSSIDVDGSSEGITQIKIGYDDYGNMIKKDIYKGSELYKSNNMGYDTDNRMIHMDLPDNLQLDFKYDNKGNRIVKTYRDNVAIINKNIYVTQFYSLKNDCVNKHITDGNNIIATKIGDNPDDIYYYHSNHLGSTAGLTDKDGNLKQSYTYYPYGEIWITENPGEAKEIDHLFTGQELDKESGLYYLKSRYYMPDIGVFNRPDSILDGLNHYAYANCNPIMYNDPDGFAAIIYRDARLKGFIDFIVDTFSHHSLVVYKLNSKIYTLNYGSYGFRSEKVGSEKYTVQYNGMDDKLFAKAVRNIKSSERYGENNNDKAKDKYNGLKNNCNSFTDEVFKEYKKLFMEKAKNEGKDPKEAWKDHFKEIKIDKGKKVDNPKDVYDFKSTKNKSVTDKIRDQAKDDIQVTNTNETGDQTSYSMNQSNSDGSSSQGSSSTGGGDCVICTELYRQGLMDKNVYKADEKFGKYLRKTKPNVMIGYHFWAKPVVRLMKKSRKITNLAYFFAKPWSEEMAYKINYKEKGNIMGKVIMSIGFFICNIIGYLIVNKIMVMSFLFFIILLYILTLILLSINRKRNTIKIKNKYLIVCFLIIIFFIFNSCINKKLIEQKALKFTNLFYKDIKIENKYKELEKFIYDNDAVYYANFKDGDDILNPFTSIELIDNIKLIQNKYGKIKEYKILSVKYKYDISSDCWTPHVIDVYIDVIYNNKNLKECLYLGYYKKEDVIKLVAYSISSD